MYRHDVAGRDLLEAARAPSFTPARRDLPALVTLCATCGDDDVPYVQAALSRADVTIVRDTIVAGLSVTDDAGAARLVAALGAAAKRDEGARARVIEILAADPRPRARRAAAIALGKIGGELARDALIAYWDRGDLPPDHRRAVAEALGKVGGDAAIARLRDVAAGSDAELGRKRDRALIMAERSAVRDAASEVAMDAAPIDPVELIARCRGGLEELLASELRELGAAVIARGAVGLRLSQPLARVWRARTLLTAGIVIPFGSGEPARAIASALSSSSDLLAHLTRGPIRWRLDFASGGHKRAIVWETAKLVAAAQPSLINDPTATTWDVIADLDARRLELRPRRFTDTRFAWRVRDVPAASHPTIAAALARVAGARDREVVWDPFVGSGAELVERAQLGPCTLIGTDLDPKALEAARANLSAAQLEARLELADARTFAAPRPTLVITNPPLGRRLRGDAPALVEEVAAHVARVLAPGGRLVWISPVPKRTERALRGLRLASRISVDLGGFDGALERWDKPA